MSEEIIVYAFAIVWSFFNDHNEGRKKYIILQGKFDSTDFASTLICYIWISG